MARPDSWFRLYNNTLDNPKVQRLTGDHFKAWINLLCVASKNGGTLPCNEDVAFALRIDETLAVTLLETFHSKGLLDQTENGWVPHDWNDLQYRSDSSTDRVKAFRERHKKPDETVSGNENVTTQEQSIADQTEKKRKRAKPDVTKYRLPDDWKPGTETFACGQRLGLTDAEIETELAPSGPFFDHFQGPECTQPERPGWDRTARKWLTRGAASIIARRPRAAHGKPAADVAHLGTQRSTYVARYRSYTTRGFWLPQFGPKPPKPGFDGEPGYDMPPDVMEEVLAEIADETSPRAAE